MSMKTSNSCGDWLLFSLLTGEKKKAREEEGENTANGSPGEKTEGVRDDTDGEGRVDREELRQVKRGSGEGGEKEI